MFFDRFAFWLVPLCLLFSFGNVPACVLSTEENRAAFSSSLVHSIHVRTAPLLCVFLEVWYIALLYSILIEVGRIIAQNAPHSFIVRDRWTALVTVDNLANTARLAILMSLVQVRYARLVPWLSYVLFLGSDLAISQHERTEIVCLNSNQPIFDRTVCFKADWQGREEAKTF